MLKKTLKVDTFWLKFDIFFVDDLIFSVTKCDFE